MFELVTNSERRTLRNLTKAFKFYKKQSESLTKDQQDFLHRLLDSIFSGLCAIDEIFLSPLSDAAPEHPRPGIDFFSSLISIWMTYYNSARSSADLVVMFEKLTCAIDSQPTIDRIDNKGLNDGELNTKYIRGSDLDESGRL